MTRLRPEPIPVVRDVATLGASSEVRGQMVGAACASVSLRIWDPSPSSPSHHCLRAYRQRAAQRSGSLVVPLGSARSPVCACHSYPLPLICVSHQMLFRLRIKAGIKEDISKGFKFPAYQGESGFKKK